MNRSRKRRKRLGLPPYGTNVVGVDIPNKMQRRLEGIRADGTKDDGWHFDHGGPKWKEPPFGWTPGSRRRGKRGERYWLIQRLLPQRPSLGDGIRQVLEKLAQFKAQQEASAKDGVPGIRDENGQLKEWPMKVEKVEFREGRDKTVFLAICRVGESRNLFDCADKEFFEWVLYQLQKIKKKNQMGKPVKLSIFLARA